LQVFIPFFGILALVGICLLFSRDRNAALRRWPLIAWGFGLQFLFALIILRVGIGRAIFGAFNDAFVAIIGSVEAGVSFVFGEDYTQHYFAFYVLSTIIFFSSLAAILYHLGILQACVRGIAWIMSKTMKTSGAETLSASGNIFLGQTEAPLMVRPFMNRMTQSELMTVMTGGFATVAGSVMAAYVSFLQDSIPGVAGHLLAASVMSAPAALVFGKVLIPETEIPETGGDVKIEMKPETDGVLDAATEGASEGVKLALNVGGMLIAFLALVALFDLCMGFFHGLIVVDMLNQIPREEFEPITLATICGYLFFPFAWLMGIPFDECLDAAKLLGIKTVTNEFVAFIELGKEAMAFDPRTRVILTYALCGFANLGSIGIQIGALSVMAPDKRKVLARLALPAMIAGTFACYSTACVAGMLYVGDDSVVKPPAEVQILEKSLEEATGEAVENPVMDTEP